MSNLNPLVNPHNFDNLHIFHQVWQARLKNIANNSQWICLIKVHLVPRYGFQAIVFCAYENIIMVNKLFPLPSVRGSKWGKKDLQSLDGVQRERQWCKLKVNVEQKSIRFAICNLMMALGARSPQCQHTWNLWYWSSSLTFHVKCRRQVLFVLLLSHINVITTFMFFSSKILEDCLKYYMEWRAPNNQQCLAIFEDEKHDVPTP